MRATRKGRAGGTKLGAAVGLIIALTVGFFAFAPSAFAHHPELSGEATCEENGTYTVDWTVGNSETASIRWMLVRAFSVTPDVGTTTGLVADGTYDGIVGPDYGGPGTLVPPGGEVEATTSGIPGDTESITLTVTGRWRYPTGEYSTTTVTETRSVKVELGGDCEAPKGSLSIGKVVTGNTAPPGASYTISYDNGAGTSGEVTVQGGEAELVSDLPFGSYTLSEIDPPAGVMVTISPNPAVVGPNSPEVEVTVTNEFPNVGGFSVKKQVTGATGGYVPGSTFLVEYSCTDDTSGSLTLENGETESVGNLPVGTQCTLSEITKPSTTGPSYVYGTESWSPSNIVTIAAGANASVTLTNPIERRFGSFSVTKQVTGATGGYVAGSTFTVSYSCTDGTEDSLVLENGETGSVENLPLGTVCTLTETVKPATSGPSYVYGPEVFSPSNVIDIDTTTNVSVTLTNPIEQRFGGVTVTKNISGAIEGYVEASTFGFTLDCTGTDHDEAFELEAGDTASFSGIPLGTTCTVTEVNVPDPVPGYEYGPPVLDPANGTVTVNSTTQPVTVTVDNPLVWLPNPQADITHDCESGGAVVTIANNGGGEVEFQILKDGEPFGPTHTLGSEDSQLVLVPMEEGEEATIAVTADGFGLLVETVVIEDCQNPAADFTVECVDEGVVVTLTNDGVLPVELTVLKNGEVVTTVEVGAEPVEVLVPMDEDETATITVSDGAEDIDEEEITFDCQPPPTEPPTTEPPSTSTTFGVGGTTELPSTGSNVGGLLSIAAGLVLAGASLLGLARRRAS